MSGTTLSGKAAALTNRSKYGEDYYSKIGKIGGSTKTENTKKRGFASNKKLAAICGSKGGSISRRAKSA